MKKIIDKIKDNALVRLTAKISASTLASFASGTAAGILVTVLIELYSKKINDAKKVEE